MLIAFNVLPTINAHSVILAGMEIAARLVQLVIQERTATRALLDTI
jgi:hypothetical protein